MRQGPKNKREAHSTKAEKESLEDPQTGDQKLIWKVRVGSSVLVVSRKQQPRSRGIRGTSQCCCPCFLVKAATESRLGELPI